MPDSGFAAALAAVRAVEPNRSKIDTILDLLDDPDRDALLAALQNPSVQTSQITKALRDIGHPLGESSVRRWREVNG